MPVLNNGDFANTEQLYRVRNQIRAETNEIILLHNFSVNSFKRRHMNGHPFAKNRFTWQCTLTHNVMYAYGMPLITGYSTVSPGDGGLSLCSGKSVTKTAAKKKENENLLPFAFAGFWKRWKRRNTQKQFLRKAGWLLGEIISLFFLMPSLI